MKADGECARFCQQVLHFALLKKKLDCHYLCVYVNYSVPQDLS